MRLCFMPIFMIPGQRKVLYILYSFDFLVSVKILTDGQTLSYKGSLLMYGTLKKEYNDSKNKNIPPNV